MATNRHRSGLDITNDILHIIASANPVISPIHESGIACVVGITEEKTFTFISRLISQELIRISYDAASNQHYEITKKGLRYLKVFADIEDDLRPVRSLLYRSWPTKWFVIY